MRILILLFAVLLAGCQTKPLEVIPTIGANIGADEVDCHYVRINKKYTLDCTIHDEGEVK